MAGMHCCIPKYVAGGMHTYAYRAGHHAGSDVEITFIASWSEGHDKAGVHLIMIHITHSARTGSRGQIECDRLLPNPPGSVQVDSSLESLTNPGYFRDSLYS